MNNFLRIVCCQCARSALTRPWMPSSYISIQPFSVENKWPECVSDNIQPNKYNIINFRFIYMREQKVSSNAAAAKYRRASISIQFTCNNNSNGGNTMQKREKKIYCVYRMWCETLFALSVIVSCSKNSLKSSTPPYNQIKLKSFRFDFLNYCNIKYRPCFCVYALVFLLFLSFIHLSRNWL